MNLVRAFILFVIVGLHTIPGYSQEENKGNFTLKLGLEERFFFQEGLYDGQKRNYLSASVQPEYLFKWGNEKFLLKASLFGRYDQHDQRRTHVDIRELYWQVVQNKHELSIGIKKIFWGVTEAAHLVNIINQTDVVESFDGEEKLGQPMLHYSYQSSVGTVDFFYMPYFRKPVYPGKNGRLRTPFVIDDRMISFESSSEEFRPDFALRWSHFIGKFDVGLSHFNGTSRQPLINSFENFQPMFAVVNQTGLDVQATTGPALWKLEAIHNENTVIDYTALAAGIEYTFSNVNRKGLDIGAVAEYLFDSRDNLSFNSLQNDIFAGTRFAFNNSQDTQILAGAIVDLRYNTQLASIEASHRLKETWKLEVEGRFFLHTDEREFIYFIRDDSFFRIAINKYF